MSRRKIFFAWELGANFGHISKIGQIAIQLTDQFEVVVAARHPTALRTLYPDLSVTLLPSPYQPTLNLTRNEGKPQSYPGALLAEGWNSLQNLRPLVEAWRSLFDLTEPDILVSQAAPTALLAARGLEMKTVMLGAGYDTPPRTTPMQAFSRGNAEAEAQAIEQETDALASANEALAHFNIPALDAFSELLNTDLTLLTSYPEVDHYSWRGDVQPDHPPYLGQIFASQIGEKVSWRNRGAFRILAYLRQDAPNFKTMMKALGQIGSKLDIILASPGIHSDLRQLLEERGITVVDGPVQLDPLLPDCNLGINHGSNGIVGAFLRAGVPQLCIPAQREQKMCAAALVNAGVGVGFSGKFDPEQVIAAIVKTLHSKNLNDAALAAKDRIVQKGLDRPTDRAAKLLRELAAS